MTRPKWILLAEDNPIDADLALRALKANEPGDEIVLAADGSEALDCLYRRGVYQGRQAGHPAVVVLDLKMPKVDGLEVLRQLKADLQLKQIPVVVFTSSREEIDVSQCYQLGANAYVVKPVVFSEYSAVLQNLRTFWVGMNESPPDGSRKVAPKRTPLATAA